MKNKKILFILAFVVMVIFASFGVYYYFNISGDDKNVQGSVRTKVIKNGTTVTVYGCPNNYLLYSTNNSKCVHNIRETKTHVENYNSTNSSYTASIKKGISLAGGGEKQFALNICKQEGYYKVKSIKHIGGNKISFTCYRRNTVKSSKLTIPYYTQNSYRDVVSTCGGTSFSGKGCLPTTSAMVISGLSNSKVSPTALNNFAKKSIGNKICYGDCYGTVNKSSYKFCTSYNGSSSYYYEALKAFAAEKGYKVTEHTKADLANIDNKLKSGKCMGFVALEANKRCKYCYSRGHFVAIYASEKTSNIYVNDPSNSANIKVEDSILNILSYAQSNKLRLICKK